MTRGQRLPSRTIVELEDALRAASSTDKGETPHEDGTPVPTTAAGAGQCRQSETVQEEETRRDGEGNGGDRGQEGKEAS